MKKLSIALFSLSMLALLPGCFCSDNCKKKDNGKKTTMKKNGNEVKKNATKNGKKAAEKKGKY